MQHCLSLPPNPAHRAEFAILSYGIVGRRTTYSTVTDMSVAPILPVGSPTAIGYVIVPDLNHPLHDLAPDPKSGLIAQVGPFAPLYGRVLDNIKLTLANGFTLPPNPTLLAAEVMKPSNVLYVLHLLRTHADNASKSAIDQLHETESAYKRATAVQF